MKTFFFLLLWFAAITSSAQTNPETEALQKKYEACKITGDKTTCAKAFYHSMDSLLNVYYQKLRNTCDKTEKENLKEQQMLWLAKRDAYFSKTKKQGDAVQMHEKNAAFVKERAEALASTTHSLYDAKHYEFDPTGTYTMKNSKVCGCSGNLDIKLINNMKMVVSGIFFWPNGDIAHDGQLMDTLKITGDSAIYTTEDESDCKIVFHFNRSGIEVKQDGLCGFGLNVFATGYYKRTSYKTPSDKDLNPDY